ncbi:MAG: TipAS antibiotic-recognition domain-containing protein [Methanobrevibacter sp.]|jgi:hypothetical protein|nr:TipAS antibiotic-recognition domain-containing protein [Candidatus Methanoflexus mossambicus]
MVSNKDIFSSNSLDIPNKYKKDTINRFGKKSYKLAYKNINKMSENFFNSYQKTLDNLFKKISKYMDNYNYNSKKIQKLIAKHYKLVNNINTVNEESYIELANLYSEHEEFIGFFNEYKNGLADFLYDAMIFFANKRLFV